MRDLIAKNAEYLAIDAKRLARALPICVGIDSSRSSQFYDRDEYKRLKKILDTIADQQKMIAVRAFDVEVRFAPVEKGIADLLAAVKKRMSNRD